MKKKQSIREQRNAKKNEKSTFYKVQQEKRVEAERKAAEAAEKLKQEHERREILARVEKEFKEEIKQKKSQAKATGVKSVFSINGNTLLMTSFGRGNEAISEKRIENGEITDLTEDPAFSIGDSEVKGTYSVNGRLGVACVNDPHHIGKTGILKDHDMIYCKEELEKRFFSRVFKDNIHIQLIYNILDIEKILALHINNIVYEMNNLLRYDDAEYGDFIGYLNAEHSYETFIKNTNKQYLVDAFNRLISQPQLGYFGIEIIKEDSKKKSGPKSFTPEEFYSILALLGQIRQGLAHGKEDVLASVYNISKKTNTFSVLPKAYAANVKHLNDDFLDKSSVNIVLLTRAYRVTDSNARLKLVKDYYGFSLTKEYKNLGVSIKKLREIMMKFVPEAQIIRDKEYDSVRSKVNPFFDFAIYRYYRLNPDQLGNTVERLRECMDEQEKNCVYVEEALTIWKTIGNQFVNQVLPELTGQNIHNVDKVRDFIGMFIDVSTLPDAKKEHNKAVRAAFDKISREVLSDSMIKEEAHPFTMMVYMLTFFLDGKEINDLLTTLINKFENIESFLKIIHENGIPGEFRPDYRMFGESGSIAQELRNVNSFARMTKEMSTAKGCMFREAAYVLGIDDVSMTVDEYLNKTMFAKNEVDKLIDSGFRNFIANNVVESSRFKYLVRYANVKKVREIANNHVVVDFVLKDIPDDQITRYYNSCFGRNDQYNDTMRSALSKIITNMNFSQFEKVKQNDEDSTIKEKEEKQRKQAAIRLYLTMLYLIVKNLVYINSRYFLAFHCVERDRILYNQDKWNKIPNDEKFEAKYGFSTFAKEFLEDHPHNKHAMNYIKTNLAHSDEWSIRSFRNTVDHIGAVRNAYLYIGDIRKIENWYDLYHYLVQRSLMTQYEHDSTNMNQEGNYLITREEVNPKIFEYFDSVSKYKTYNKDFVKALNVPFSYNLARYKNLSIDGLFDKNRPGVKGCGMNME